MSKRFELVFEWFCTALLLTGVVLISLNIYPLSIWVALAGNISWIALGYVWRKWSLVVMQVVIALIYVVGIIKLYM